METKDIVLLIGSLFVIGVWFAVLHTAEKEARRKLGHDVVEIPLSRRWAHPMRWLLPVFIVGIPVALAVVGILNNIPFDEMFFEIIQFLGFGSLIYGLRKASVMMIGSKGISLGPKHQVEWDRVDDLKWDKDIGQRLWGLTLSVWDPKRKYRSKQRYYVRRQMKDEVTAQIGRYHGGVLEESGAAVPA